MTIEADIVDAITPACARVFLGFAPARQTKPYVIVTQVGGSVINLLDNSDPGKYLSEFQVNTWATTYKEAIDLSRAVEVLMRASTDFIATPLHAAVADFDSDVPIYGARQDFRCIHS